MHAYVVVSSYLEGLWIWCIAQSIVDFLSIVELLYLESIEASGATSRHGGTVWGKDKGTMKDI